jgi:hypothetical protein
MNVLRALAATTLLTICSITNATEPSMTLEQLQKRQPFSSWIGMTDTKAVQASTLIYQATVSSLIRIGLGKPSASYMPTLNGYIEEFNRLDAQYHFIETVEREDICERLAEIVVILKLPGTKGCDDLSAVRNW